jgi:acetyl esterase
MPLDPEAKAWLEETTDPDAPSYARLTPREARESLKKTWTIGGPREAVAKIEDISVPGLDALVPLRIYTPKGRGPFGVLAYFHGGGWVAGDLDTYDPLCRILANASGCSVACIGYRLAPEHKFPAGLEDCYTAVRWVAKNAPALRMDPRRIAVGGDSAGGNLAAAVSIMARDLVGPAIQLQLLLYPCTSFLSHSASYSQFREGFYLTAEAMEWFTGQYLPEGTDRSHPYLSPLLAGDLSNLPPALVITGEYDPLRDDAEAYAARLQDAGNEALSIRYMGQLHGFCWPSFTAGRLALASIGSTLERTIGFLAERTLV